MLKDTLLPKSLWRSSVEEKEKRTERKEPANPVETQSSLLQARRRNEWRQEYPKSIIEFLLVASLL